MTDPLRERLIARLTSGQPHAPVIAAHDLADAVLEIVDGELGRLREENELLRSELEHTNQTVVGQRDAALVGPNKPDMPCTRRPHDDDTAHFNDQYGVSWFDPEELRT